MILAKLRLSDLVNTKNDHLLTARLKRLFDRTEVTKVVPKSRQRSTAGKAPLKAA
jgi:hypothetical protein